MSTNESLHADIDKFESAICMECDKLRTANADLLEALNEILSGKTKSGCKPLAKHGGKP